MERLRGSAVQVATTVTEERPKTILTFNQIPHRFRPFGQCLSRVRARLHLLLRPADARLPAFPRVSISNEAVVKRCPGTAAETLARPRYAPGRRHRHQHRSLPADRAALCIDTPSLRGFAETRHPVTITTKSDRGAARPGFARRARRTGAAAVAISVTSLDPALAPSSNRAPRRRPNASRALGKLAEAGVPPIARSRR